jgi:hypothetical protein
LGSKHFALKTDRANLLPQIQKQMPAVKIPLGFCTVSVAFLSASEIGCGNLDLRR